MAKGFSGIPGNMGAMLKQAQKMQENLLKAQEEAQNLTAEGSAGGGMVKVLATGGNRLKSIKIEKDVVNPDDIEMLQDLVMAACNDALERVQNEVKSKLEQVTGGMSLPGLF